MEAEEGTARGGVLRRLTAQMGCWAPRPRVPWKGGAPQARWPILGLRLQGPHLRPGPELENRGLFSEGRGHCSPRERRPLDTSRDAPWDSLMPCWSGCGMDRQTDRQTEIFGCRLFAYWLKATGNGNVFAVIKVGPCGGGGAQGHGSWGRAGPPSSGWRPRVISPCSRAQTRAFWGAGCCGGSSGA